jgi:hypothetical protein
MLNSQHQNHGRAPSFGKVTIVHLDIALPLLLFSLLNSYVPRRPPDASSRCLPETYATIISGGS